MDMQVAKKKLGLKEKYQVMTRGLGAMYSYADRVPPEDMWAIAAHLRVLQLSQHADLGLLNEEERRRVEGAPR